MATRSLVRTALKPMTFSAVGLPAVSWLMTAQHGTKRHKLVFELKLLLDSDLVIRMAT